jgi:hypothetical protein
MSGNIAPTPQFPERSPNVYEAKVVAATPGERGPLRFEEGIATDTDIPNEFARGALQGYITPPGRPNHNTNVWEKPAEETIRERAHVGSAAWVESNDFLGEFAGGAFSDHAEQRYEEVIRNGGHQYRANPATVID